MSHFRSLCSPISNKCSFFLMHIVTCFALLFFFSGCSGITPVELRNNREEGPENGIFSGSGGEFVLMAPSAGKQKIEDTDEAAKAKSE